MSEQKNERGSDSDSMQLDNDCCSICLEHFHKEEVSQQLVCQHKFHNDCITFWLTKHGTCPCCRSKICEPLEKPDDDGTEYWNWVGDSEDYNEYANDDDYDDEEYNEDEDDNNDNEDDDDEDDDDDDDEYNENNNEDDDENDEDDGDDDEVDKDLYQVIYESIQLHKLHQTSTENQLFNEDKTKRMIITTAQKVEMCVDTIYNVLSSAPCFNWLRCDIKVAYLKAIENSADGLLYVVKHNKFFKKFEKFITCCNTGCTFIYNANFPYNHAPISQWLNDTSVYFNLKTGLIILGSEIIDYNKFN